MYRVKTISALLLLLAAMFVSCGESKEEQARKAGEAAKLKKERAIRELAEKHNALTEWDRDTILYTIQLQDLLVKSGKPILFRGYVHDIFEKDGQCYIHFVKKTILTILLNEPEIHFILKFHAGRVAPIIATAERGRGPSTAALRLLEQDTTAYYAVVAKISNVSRPDLRIAAHPPLSSGEVELHYEPSPTFIAGGDCIDLIYIGATSGEPEAVTEAQEGG